MTKRFLKPTALALLVAIALIHRAAPAAAEFSVTCQVLDPVTQAVRGTFAAGEEMLVRFDIEVPPEAANRQISLKLSARASIGGIAIPYTLDELAISIPNQNPDLAGDGATPFPSETRLESHLVEIPSSFPAGTYELRAKASIEGVGKQACEMKVVVTAALAR